MIVDRVARAMTEGAPRAGFTARVMAPIHGRPQPGFTARVMAGLDAPRPRAGVRALRPALIAAAAVAITVAAALWWPAGPAMPPAPDAPRIAARPYDRELIGIPPLPYNRWAPEHAAREAVARAEAPRPVEPARQSVATAEPAEQPAPPIYMIAPLEGPGDIRMKSIEPAPFTIRALEPPAPLTVAALPWATPEFGPRNFKEKP